MAIIPDIQIFLMPYKNRATMVNIAAKVYLALRM